MIQSKHLAVALFMATATLAPMGARDFASAATSQDLDRDSQQALQTLRNTNPLADKLAKEARAVLVFPNIVKAGLVFGGSYGEGELLHKANVDSYYNSVTASWGLQAGAQSYGYVVFLMSKKAVSYLHQTHGWEIGVGPTVVVVDEGVAKTSPVRPSRTTLTPSSSISKV